MKTILCAITAPCLVLNRTARFRIRLLAWFGVSLLLGMTGSLQLRLDPNGSQFLQFTSGGHVLGFGETAMYAVAQNHFLKVEYIGGRADSLKTQPGDRQVPGARSQTRPFERIEYQELWPGITLEYEQKAKAIAKSTYRIRAGLPGRPLDRIQLRYNQPVYLDARGNLHIIYQTGEMVEAAPTAWQETPNGRKTVPAAYIVKGENVVGFIANYDRRYELVVDPTLSWNTFLGSDDTDITKSIAVDGDGNVYVSGYSVLTWGAPVRGHDASGLADAFVAKLASDGSLIWNTFLGGSGGDEACGIAVDGDGNVYVAGNGTTTWGTPIRGYAGFIDAFVAKLTSAGTLTWNTFLGSTGEDQARGLAVDGNGYIEITGFSDWTWGAPVRPHSTYFDAFVAKLASDGSLVWNTFLGGSGLNDKAYSLAVDGSDNVYVAGASDASWGMPIRSYIGGNDAFVVKLASDGSLTWNTFLGANGEDAAKGITVAGSNVYIAGFSFSTWETPVRPHAGANNKDAFVAKLTSGGNLVWNTFLGGNGSDAANGIDLDSGENAYIAGDSNETWGTPLWAYSQAEDAFAAKVATDGSLFWNTFLGSSGSDEACGIAVNESGDAVLAGTSDMTWGAPVRLFTAGYDSWAAKLAADTPTSTVTPTMTVTISSTPSHTPSVTSSHTPSVTSSHTPSVTSSHTPSVTSSHTPSVTSSHTP
ncbi:SBBP repeat-containing protein, partial [candidate division FCPU426 bacterium]|nr:SBBP repeat-containing protein [candidate division FCPU426 bacterium]